MTAELVAGIDVGTTTIRAAVFDLGGQRLAIVGQTIGTSHPVAGIVEQDPWAMVDVAVAMLAAACDAAGCGVADVGLLGITNQRSSVVAWDAITGDALHPVIGWQDTRTRDRAAELQAIGLPVTTSASCTKLEWLATNPDCAAAARLGRLRMGTIDTWLTYRLSGGTCSVTDPSNAGATGLYAAGTHGWNDAALELFGLDSQWLAPVVHTDEHTGTTDAALVGAEIQLAARAGDQMAACAAHGLGPGETKLTLGTSGMVDVMLGTDRIDPPSGTYVMPAWSRHDAPADASESYIVEGSIQTAGAAIEWLVSIGVLAQIEDIDRLAAAGRDGVRFVPALAGYGSPRHDPDARAVLSGLGLDSGPPEIARAVLAGIAARVAEIAELLNVGDSIVVDGGLSRSRVLLQLIADATGRIIRPAADPETTVRGIAQLAARANDWSLAYGPTVTPAR